MKTRKGLDNWISKTVRDIVFGMEDGLVSHLGLVLGVYFGSKDFYAVILAGMASMIAGAFSMSAGTYLSAKSQREVYEQEINKTNEYLNKNPKQCLKRMELLLKKEGLTKNEVKALINNSHRKHHPQFICNYVAQKKVGISKEKLDLPLKNAFTMFLAFLLGSIFPIFPFFLKTKFAVYIAIILTTIVLLLVGIGKTIYTKRNWFKSGMEIVLVGIGAGVLGYLVGFLVHYFIR